MIKTVRQQFAHMKDRRGRSGCSTPEQYRARHQEAMAKSAKAGIDVNVVESAAPLACYVNHGRWIADCVCGAGVAVDPQWDRAYCFGCGRVHTTLVFPDDVPRIEAVLEERPRDLNRNWKPGETVRDLQVENLVFMRPQDVARKAEELVAEAVAAATVPRGIDLGGVPDVDPVAQAALSVTVLDAALALLDEEENP